MTPKRRTLDRRSRLFRVFARFQTLALLLICLAGLAQAQTTVNIHDIENDLPASPYLGDSVTTNGIVIAVLSDGFYIENPQNSWDSNVCTAEGIYVYTPTGLPSNAVSGNSLTVTGVVQASNNSNYAGAEIYIASPQAGTNVVTNSTGNSLPGALSSSILTGSTEGGCPLYPAGTFGQWLPFEGMRVNVPSSSSLLVTQGTGGTVTPSTQTATSNGQFWAVFTTTRPFRATGISELDIVPSTAPSTVQHWTGNPQLLLVDTTALGGTALNASATTEYTGSSDLVGIIDYHVSAQGYTGLLLTADSVSALSRQGGATPTVATTRGSDEITYATQNLESSPGVGLASTETDRIAKLANAIVNYEKSPDVIAVQGVASAALPLLEGAIVTAGGPSYSDLGTYSTVDANGYVNAFLVNLSRFDGAPVVTQALATTAYTPVSPATETILFDRSPLVITVSIPRRGIPDFAMTIVNAILQDRVNIDDTNLGADVRNRREQQAELLTTQVLEPYATAGDHMMVLGGYDSFEFSDGYVDALGILDGSEAANTSTGTLVTLYDTTYNSTALENTTTAAENLTAYAADSSVTVNPATSRYTYVESGSAEQPDHILITPEMANLVSIDYARFGADFPVSETYDSTTVERASSHDGVVAYFTIPYPTTTVVTSAPNPSYYDEPVTFTATVSVTGTTAAGTPDGTVTFLDTDGTTLGAGTLNSSGVATFTISTLTVGTHTITASYGGSDSGLGYQASSGTVQHTVWKDISSLTLASSVNPSDYGQPVTFTATATSSNGTGGSGATPTGAVIFTDTTNSATLGTGTLNSSGIATFTISTLYVGTHLIQATYSGDSTDLLATSNTVSQVVQANITTATVTSSENPSYFGDGVIFTATEVGSYGTPTGTVTFYDATNATILGTGTLSAGLSTYTAAATFTISTLSIGSHTIQALYMGDGTNSKVAARVIQVVNINTTTLTLSSSLNPSYFGNSVTFTATAVGASGTPTGTITFYNGTAAIGTGTLASGTATVTTSALPVGTDAIVTTYGGSGVHSAATSNTVNQVVQPVYATISTLVCSPNPTEYGTTVTCTDSVAASVGQPGGTVTFYDGTTSLGTETLTAGTATWSSTSLAVGSHTITASYALNDPYLASTSNSVAEIIVSTFSLTAKPAAATIFSGEAAESTITVTPGTGFNLDVALVCTGLPANTTCTLTPSTVTGGSGASKLTIQTTAPSQTKTTASHRPGGRAWPLLAGLLLLFVPRRSRRRVWLPGLLICAALAAVTLSGCGGSGTLNGGTPPGTYTVSVVGTATDGTLPLTQTATVTVKVESLF